VELKPNFSEEGLVRTFKSDKLHVRQYENRDFIGRTTAAVTGELIRKVIAEKGKARVEFASAMSQTDFYKYLPREKGIDWSRVDAFHLDQYVDFPLDHEMNLAKFLEDGLICKLKGINWYPINSEAKDPETECRRYRDLLQEAPIDIMICGTGESGHVGFIDPPYFHHDDPEYFKLTDIGQQSHAQMVHDGMFEKEEDVPRRAYTITLKSYDARVIILMVPTRLKANAIKGIIEGPISEDMPTSYLRTIDNVWILIDNDSAGLLTR